MSSPFDLPSDRFINNIACIGEYRRECTFAAKRLRSVIHIFASGLRACTLGCGQPRAESPWCHDIAISIPLEV